MTYVLSKSTVPGVETVDLIERIRELEAEVKRLKALHHDIYEVYAGSEGIPCETASEGYLCSLISKMVTLAAEGKS